MICIANTIVKIHKICSEKKLIKIPKPVHNWKGSEFISMKFITDPLKVITPIFFNKESIKNILAINNCFQENESVFSLLECTTNPELLFRLVYISATKS
tara:strand:- start:27 stop:323 length:297 start_codon:yes stop_codon:yes gene_type:complete